MMGNKSFQHLQQIESIDKYYEGVDCTHWSALVPNMLSCNVNHIVSIAVQ